MTEVRIPLVSYTRTEGDEKHTRLTYYTGDTMILDMDILKDFLPSTGEVDNLVLVQLLVTPHEYMAILGDIVSYAKANKTTGKEWEALIQRATQLISPPPESAV